MLTLRSLPSTPISSENIWPCLGEIEWEGGGDMERDKAIGSCVPDFLRDQGGPWKAWFFSPLTFMKPDVAVMLLKCQPVSSQNFPSASNCPLITGSIRWMALHLRPACLRLTPGLVRQWIPEPEWGPLALHSCVRVAVNPAICQEDQSRARLLDAPEGHHWEGFKMWLKALKETRSLSPQQWGNWDERWPFAFLFDDGWWPIFILWWIMLLDN